jgi:hypothetical protein
MESPQFVNEENVIDSIVAFFARNPTNHRMDLFRALKLYNENDFLAYVSNKKIIDNFLTDAPLYSICINLGEKLQPHGLAIYRFNIGLWVIRYDNPEYLETIDKKDNRPTQKKFNMAIREHVSRKSANAIPSMLDVKKSASIAPSLVSTPVLDSPTEFPKLGSVFRKIGKSTENSLTFASMVKASPDPSPLCVEIIRRNTVTPISETMNQSRNRLSTKTPMSQVYCSHSWAGCDCSDGEDDQLANHKPVEANHQPVEANHQAKANHKDLLTFMEDKDLINYEIHSGYFIKIPKQSSLNWIKFEHSKFDVQMKSITLNGVNGLQIQISATLPNGQVFFAGKYYIR